MCCRLTSRRRFGLKRQRQYLMEWGIVWGSGDCVNVIGVGLQGVVFFVK